MTDVKGILQSVKKKDYLMYIISLVEAMIAEVLKEPTKYKRTPESIVQATIIFDMDQFSMRHITYKPGRNLLVINFKKQLINNFILFLYLPK